MKRNKKIVMDSRTGIVKEKQQLLYQNITIGILF
jgi:hypothetical protein